MRTEQIKNYLASGIFASCPSYMESLISTVNSGEIAKQTIEDISPSHSYEVQDNVAIISIDGAMTKKNTWMNAMCGGFVSYDIISEYRNMAEIDNRVDTVLYDIDSPGGDVAGVDEVGEQVYTSSKETVTFYRNLGASAAVWGFSGSKKRYANKTALIGSIGVMAGYREAEENGDIILVSKNAQNKNCSLTGDCKQKIQARIDDVETIFYDRVVRNTGLSKSEIASHFGYGDVISAEDAMEVGFLDGVTTFDALLKSLKINPTIGSTFVPTASVSENLASDNSNETNQGADMAFDRNDLDATEAHYNALVANKATMDNRNDTLKVELQTVATALEAKTEEMTKLEASHKTELSEAEENLKGFKAETTTRLQEASTTGVSVEVAMTMVDADSAEDASALALRAKESDGGTRQGEVSGVTKEKASIDYATNIAQNYSV